MNYRTRFYSLTGAPKTIREEYHETEQESLDALRIYAESQGFRNIKMVDEEDGYHIRVTATTPNGRPGRNIGSIEPGEGF
jgi:hypothetical protein